MKKLVLLFASIALIAASCSQQNARELLNNPAQRNEIFHVILHDHVLTAEIMDSMMLQHHDEMMTMMDSMMMNDSQMQDRMMGNIMTMCDMDSMKCMKMVGMIKQKPNVMKCCMNGMQGMSGM